MTRSGDCNVVVDKGFDELKCPEVGVGTQSKCSHDVRCDECTLGRKAVHQHDSHHVFVKSRLTCPAHLPGQREQ